MFSNCTFAINNVSKITFHLAAIIGADVLLKNKAHMQTINVKEHQVMCLSEMDQRFRIDTLVLAQSK